MTSANQSLRQEGAVIGHPESYANFHGWAWNPQHPSYKHRHGKG